MKYLFVFLLVSIGSNIFSQEFPNGPNDKLIRLSAGDYLECGYEGGLLWIANKEFILTFDEYSSIGEIDKLVCSLNKFDKELQQEEQTISDGHGGSYKFGEYFTIETIKSEEKTFFIGSGGYDGNGEWSSSRILLSSQNVKELVAYLTSVMSLDLSECNEEIEKEKLIRDFKPEFGLKQYTKRGGFIRVNSPSWSETKQDTWTVLGGSMSSECKKTIEFNGDKLEKKFFNDYESGDKFVLMVTVRRDITGAIYNMATTIEVVE